METTETVQLTFGYTKGLPEGTDTAYGARAIYDGNWVDFLPDRQCAEGPRKYDLLDYLNKNVNQGVLKDKIKQLVCPDYPGMKKPTPEVILHDDDTVVVKANTQASFGYVYICAYFKE